MEGQRKANIRITKSAKNPLTILVNNATGIFLNHGADQDNKSFKTTTNANPKTMANNMVSHAGNPTS